MQARAGVTAEDYILIHRQRQGGAGLGLAGAFETSEPTSSERLPPTRPHLLIPLRLLGD